MPAAGNAAKFERRDIGLGGGSAVRLLQVNCQQLPAAVLIDTSSVEDGVCFLIQTLVLPAFRSAAMLKCRGYARSHLRQMEQLKRRPPRLAVRCIQRGVLCNIAVQSTAGRRNFRPYRARVEAPPSPSGL